MDCRTGGYLRGTGQSPVGSLRQLGHLRLLHGIRRLVQFSFQGGSYIVGQSLVQCLVSRCPRCLDGRWRGPRGWSWCTSTMTTSTIFHLATHSHGLFIQKLLKGGLTSTETVGLLGTGAQNVHLDFHTAPEL